MLTGEREAALGEPLQLRGRHGVDDGPAVGGGESPCHSPPLPGSTVSARSTLSAESSAAANVVTSAGSSVPGTERVASTSNGVLAHAVTRPDAEPSSRTAAV